MTRLALVPKRLPLPRVVTTLPDLPPGPLANVLPNRLLHCNWHLNYFDFSHAAFVLLAAAPGVAAEEVGLGEASLEVRRFW